MENLTILIIGQGAREHVISEAYEKSPQVKRVIITPGNDFIAFQRRKEVIIDGNCHLKYPKSILEVAKKYKPDLVDVAQDDALALGTVNLLQENGFNVFGPKKDAARIEGDKAWSRKLMERYKIPRPKFTTFSSEKWARNFVESIYNFNPNQPIFVKASGLCAGKGALKAINLEEALKKIEQMKTFREAGETFLIEEALEGKEFSYYVISDGENFRVFKSAQDYKRALNNDQGEQTGGMGAISPTLITKGIEKEIESELISKAIKGMKEEGYPYQGVLYLGGMNIDGKSFVIEYNARWGDPECQVVLPSLQNDYVNLVLSAIEGRLDEVDLKQDDLTRVCVVGVSRGYPGDYSSVKGKRIHGLEEAMKVPGVTIYGAGIKVEDNKFYADLGRLFSVVAKAEEISDAEQKTYEAMQLVNIEGNNLHYRKDIGK